MAASRTMTGARAVLSIDGVVVGIIANCSYQVGLDVKAVETLGRFSAAELVTTGMEPISITLTGFRVVGDSPYKTMAVPKLFELLNTSTFSISMADRQTGETIMSVPDCLSTGYSSSVAPKSLQEMTVNYMGLILSDENNVGDDEGGDQHGTVPSNLDQI